MNPAVLRQQMGHSSAVMTARYTGEIPLDKVQEAFSKMELENMEVIGKRPRCTGSRLVVYKQQTRGMSGRHTMVVPKLCAQFDFWWLRVSFGSHCFCLSSQLVIAG
jgi:hypothetical protein